MNQYRHGAMAGNAALNHGKSGCATQDISGRSMTQHNGVYTGCPLGAIQRYIYAARAASRAFMYVSALTLSVRTSIEVLGLRKCDPTRTLTPHHDFTLVEAI